MDHGKYQFLTNAHRMVIQNQNILQQIDLKTSALCRLTQKNSMTQECSTWVARLPGALIHQCVSCCHIAKTNYVASGQGQLYDNFQGQQMGGNQVGLLRSSNVEPPLSS